MTGEQLAILLVRFGPIAFDLASELSDVWGKSMTPAEVKAFCLSKRKSHDDYVAAERASRITA